MSEKPTLIDRMRARIYGLANRGADICACFQPRSHDDGGLAQSCAVCGYYADVHLLRDALNDLEARAASAPVEAPASADPPDPWPDRCEAIMPAGEALSGTRCGMYKGHAGAHTVLSPSKAAWFGRGSSPSPSASVAPPDCNVRCKVTNNPCGTDTWVIGRPCKCSHCQAWVAGHAAAEYNLTRSAPSASGEGCIYCKGELRDGAVVVDEVDMRGVCKPCVEKLARWHGIIPKASAASGEGERQDLERLRSDRDEWKQLANQSSEKHRAIHADRERLRSALTALVEATWPKRSAKWRKHASPDLVNQFAATAVEDCAKEVRFALASASSGDAGTTCKVCGGSFMLRDIARCTCASPKAGPA